MPRKITNVPLTMTGIDEIDRKLKALARETKNSIANKVARQAINAGLTETSKAIRREISADPHSSPRLKRALKKTIGKRFKKYKSTGNVIAKAGLGVAKKQPALKKRGKGRGVGVSATNVHWFALGAKDKGKKDRYTKSPKASRGKLGGTHAVRRAWRATQAATTNKIRGKARERMEIEINRLRSKGGG